MAASSYLFLIVILVCSPLCQFALASPSSDVAALQELLREWQAATGSTQAGALDSTVFENWSLDKDEDPCTSGWNGVVCSPSKSVIHLHLNGANLSGDIPTAIGALDELKILDLSGNPLLVSCIPSEIGNLRRLTHLKLSDCNFSGKVPQEIYKLSELEYLDLSNNPHLSLDQDAQDIVSLRQHSYSTFNHHQALLQVNR